MRRFLTKLKGRLIGGRAAAEDYRFRGFVETDQAVLRAQAADFFGMSGEQVDQYYAEYRGLHEREGYGERFGERKTLCFEEAFLINLILAVQRPRNLVEIGTQHGKSTRRILDAVRMRGLPTRVTCYDLEDQVKFFRPEEARLVLHDLTVDFEHAVLSELRPEAIYLDARPYGLLRKVIGEYLAWDGNCMMAIHDCAQVLFNPRMTLARENPAVTTQTGVWERYLLAELMGVADPGSERLEDVATATHRLRIFSTPHGLAVIRPLVGAVRPE